MFNDIHIGSITIHMYGIMFATGFLVALLLTLYRAKKRGLSTDVVWGIFYCAIIGGVAGGKLLFFLTNLREIIEMPSLLLDFQNGFVIYGGILGGIFASWIYIRVKKEDFFTYFDLVMPAVAAAQGCGRLGCFFAGCCYGRETDGPFHIVFTHSDFAPNNVPLVPTQLLSSAGDFLNMAVLLLFARRKPKKGRVAAVYLMFYGVGRFVIEFFRADYRGAVGPFSTSQFISFFIVTAGIALFFLAPKITGEGKKAAMETAAVTEKEETAAVTEKEETVAITEEEENEEKPEKTGEEKA